MAAPEIQKKKGLCVGYAAANSVTQGICYRSRFSSCRGSFSSGRLSRFRRQMAFSTPAQGFLSIFLGFQSTFRLKGGRQHGVSSLLALQAAAACSTFTSTANLLEGTIYSIKIKNSLQYIASFGDPGGIRTHGLSLRSGSDKQKM